MKRYLDLSNTVYDKLPGPNYWRKTVFFVRALSHQKQMKKLMEFFKKNSIRREIAAAHPCVFEQATRQWFYHNSTLVERVAIIKEHHMFIGGGFTEEALRSIYIGDGLTLWSAEYQEETLALKLHFHTGSHEKEGLMAIMLTLGDKRIYQIIFWIGPNDHGEASFWIGALQGSPGGLDTIRGLTKYLSGYRPQNLVLHAVRTISQQLGLKNCYAVSNEGFYANNHIRLDRKLKTSLDDFWQESGGSVCSDTRFFNIPIIEPRKNIADIDTKKRSLYKKRFAMIDTIDHDITQKLEQSCYVADEFKYACP